MSTLDIAAPRAAGTIYYVYADYGYVSQREIYSGTDYAAAYRTWISETVDPTDMDCEISIDLAFFLDDGTYETDQHQALEEADEDWGDEGVYDENHPATACHF